MLAPITELHYTESALLRLNLDSLARYPSYVAELDRRRPGCPPATRSAAPSRPPGTAPTCRRCATCTRSAPRSGLTSHLLTGRELRALEPSLAPGLPGGLLAEYDHQVDPRLLHAAQLRAALDLGVHVHAHSARLDVRAGRGSGVVLDDGTTLAADTVVLAAGAWSGRLDAVPVRPVKGQTLRLRLPGRSRLARVVRGDGQGHAGLHRAARRRTGGDRRIERGGRLRRHAARRRGVRAAARRAVGRAGAGRGRAGGGVHRPASGQCRQRAADRRRPGSTGCCTRPGTTATASCWRRSPPTRSPRSSPTARCPTVVAPFAASASGRA